jgi:hypothetical protein
MYSHPNAIDSQRRLFGRRRRSLCSVFWSIYFVLALSAIVLAGAFFFGGVEMQPWDNVQVNNEESPFFGRAGVVISVNRQSGHVVVRLDASATDDQVDAGVDVSELKRL